MYTYLYTCTYSVLEPLLLKQFSQWGTQQSTQYVNMLHCVRITMTTVAFANCSYRWWVRMYTDIMDLLRTSMLLKPESCLALLTEREVVLALCGIISVLRGEEQNRKDETLGMNL